MITKNGISQQDENQNGFPNLMTAWAKKWTANLFNRRFKFSDPNPLPHPVDQNQNIIPIIVVNFSTSLDLSSIQKCRRNRHPVLGDRRRVINDIHPGGSSPFLIINMFVCLPVKPLTYWRRQLTFSESFKLGHGYKGARSSPLKTVRPVGGISPSQF